MRSISIIIHLLFIPLLCFSQVSIKEKIFRANQLLEAGNISEAVTLAESCLDAKSTTELWQANHLLAIAYLAQNEFEKARISAENMMQLNPTYKPSTLTDPTELIKLLKTITVIPKLSLGLAATFGGNISFPKILKSYTSTSNSKTYMAKSSWQVGLISNYALNSTWGLHTGIIVSNKKYDINYSVDQVHDIEVKETNTFLDIPLYVSMSSNPGKNLVFSAEAGVYGGYLAKTHTDFIIESNYNDSFSETLKYENIDGENRKTKFEYGGVFGASVRKNFGKVNLVLDAKYYKAIAYNLTAIENRKTNTDLLYNFYFIDDDLRLDNLTLSLSFSYNISYRVIRKNKI